MSRQLDQAQLGGIELFCLVAQHQGFTAAARAAGITTAAVSRSIHRLESRLGVRLLTRTTRSVRLTPEGQGFYEQCRSALNLLAEAEREVTGQQRMPGGQVRISLPTSYAHHRVLPVLDEFMRAYPDISLEIHVSNQNIRFTEEGFDLAIRGRTPPDSGLVARKLEDAELVIVGTPAYLNARGRPESVEALLAHECIQFMLPSTGATVPWVLNIQGEAKDVETPGRIRCAQDILAPVTVAKSGFGLAQTYRYLVQNELKTGELEEVMTGFAGAKRPFSLLYPANRHLPLRVRVLIDFLIQRFQLNGIG